jgi:formylmethanofuran dehydrogenase subunit E
MSFVRQNLRLSETPKQPAHPMKTCSKCAKERVPEGGIELGPGRWICAVCWTHKIARKR